MSHWRCQWDILKFRILEHNSDGNYSDGVRETENSGINIIPADALSATADRASAGIILTVCIFVVDGVIYEWTQEWRDTGNNCRVSTRAGTRRQSYVCPALALLGIGVTFVITGELGAPGTELGAKPEPALPESVGELWPEIDERRLCSFTMG